MEDGKYAKELDVAVRVVHMACSLCQRVQESLVSLGRDQVTSKDDDSPVTVAGTSILGFYFISFLRLCVSVFVFKLSPTIKKEEKLGSLCFFMGVI